MLRKLKIGMLIFVGILLVLNILAFVFEDNEGQKDAQQESDNQQQSKPSKEELAQSIKGMHGKIVKVDPWINREDKYRISIFIDEGRSVSGSSLVFMLAQDMVEVAREVVGSQEKKAIDEIIFFARDGSGDLLFKAWLQMDTLDQKNLQDLPSQSLLSLTSNLEVRPRGKQAIASYCQDKENKRLSRQFCSAALQ